MRHLIFISILIVSVLNVGVTNSQVPLGSWESPHTWSLDLDTFVMGTKTSIRIYRTDRSTPIIIPNQNDVRSLVLHPTQNLLASTDRSGSVRLWDTRSGELLNKWDSRDHAGNALRMEFDSRSSILWILFYRNYGGDSVIYALTHWRYDLPATNYFEYKFGEGSAVCCFNLQSGLVITYRRDTSSGGYGWTTITPKQLFTGNELQGFSLGISFDQIVSLKANPFVYGFRSPFGVVFAVNLANDDLMSPTTPPSITEVIGLSDDGQFLLTSGNDRKLRQWNIATKELIAIYPNQPINVNALRMNEQGQILAFSVSTQEAKVVNAQTLEIMVEFVIIDMYSELDQ